MICTTFCIAMKLQFRGAHCAGWADAVRAKILQIRQVHRVKQGRIFDTINRGRLGRGTNAQ